MSGSTRNIRSARRPRLGRVVLWTMFAALVAVVVGFAAGYVLGRALL
jgi:hypothetical protein